MCTSLRTVLRSLSLLSCVMVFIKIFTWFLFIPLWYLTMHFTEDCASIMSCVDLQYMYILPLHIIVIPHFIGEIISFVRRSCHCDVNTRIFRHGDPCPSLFFKVKMWERTLHWGLCWELCLYWAVLIIALHGLSLYPRDISSIFAEYDDIMSCLVFFLVLGALEHDWLWYGPSGCTWFATHMYRLRVRIQHGVWSCSRGRYWWGDDQATPGNGPQNDWPSAWPWKSAVRSWADHRAQACLHWRAGLVGWLRWTCRRLCNWPDLRLSCKCMQSRAESVGDWGLVNNGVLNPIPNFQLFFHVKFLPFRRQLWKLPFCSKPRSEIELIHGSTRQCVVFSVAFELTVRQCDYTICARKWSWLLQCIMYSWIGILFVHVSLFSVSLIDTWISTGISALEASPVGFSPDFDVFQNTLCACITCKPINFSCLLRSKVHPIKTQSYF